MDAEREKKNSDSRGITYDDENCDKPNPIL